MFSSTPYPESMSNAPSENDNHGVKEDLDLNFVPKSRFPESSPFPSSAFKSRINSSKQDNSTIVQSINLNLIQIQKRHRFDVRKRQSWCY